MLGERMRECSLTGTRPLSTSRSVPRRSEEHTSELQSRQYLVCRLLLEKKKKNFELHSSQLHVFRRLLKNITHTNSYKTYNTTTIYICHYHRHDKLMYTYQYLKTLVLES